MNSVMMRAVDSKCKDVQTGVENVKTIERL